MSKDPLEQDDEGLYRGRGRPKLPAELRRREKLNVSLTADELERVLVAAAKAGHRRVQDWAREVLLGAAPPKDGE